MTMKKPVVTTSSINSTNDLLTIMRMPIMPPVSEQQSRRRVIFPTLYRGNSACSSSNTNTNNSDQSSVTSIPPKTTPTTPDNNATLSSSSCCLQKRLQWQDSVEQQHQAVNKTAASAAGFGLKVHPHPHQYNALLPPSQLLSSPLVLPKSPGLRPRAVKSLASAAAVAVYDDDVSPEIDLLQQLPAGVSLTQPCRSSKTCLKNKRACTLSKPQQQQQQPTKQQNAVPCYRRNQRMILPPAFPGASSAHLVAIESLEFIMAPSLAVGGTAPSALQPLPASSCSIASLDFIMAPSLAVADTAPSALQQQPLPIVPPSPPMAATVTTTNPNTTTPERPHRSLRSILRSSSSYEGKNSSNSSKEQQQQMQQEEILLVSKISSVESDIPSLASSTTSLDDSGLAASSSSNNSGVSLFCLPRLYRRSSSSALSLSSSSAISSSPTPPPLLYRSQSTPVQRSSCGGNVVAFDPRVWVREFQRSHHECLGVTWYTASDLERFKLEAFQRIIHYNETTRLSEKNATHTTRSNTHKGKALFSHCALQAGSVENNETTTSTAASPCSSTTNNKCISKRRREALRAIVTMEELRKVLIILQDHPNNNNKSSSCLHDFSKSLKNVLPHVQVVQVHSHREAMKRVQEARFDVIFSEPQQQDGGSSSSSSSSSSAVLSLQHVRSQFDNDDKSLFISVIDKQLQQQQQDVKKNSSSLGADVYWTTPLELNQGMVDTMLHELLLKRGRGNMARELSR